MISILKPQKTPSKRIIYLGMAAFLVVVGIFVYKNRSSASILSEKMLSYKAASGADDQTDTDMDGLPDWQEKNVWHTDPNNPDSDEDGTPDGEEVNQGRDPAKGGDGDTLNTDDLRLNSAIKVAIANDNSASENLTQNLSKNFATNFLSLSDSESDMSDEQKAKVVSDTLSGISPPPLAQKYTVGSLKIYNPKNSEEIKSYANSFALIQKNDLSEYLSDQNPSFEKTAGVYKNLAENLSKLDVPREVLEIHLNIINTYNQMYLSLLDTNNYESDPVKALLSMKIYQDGEASESLFYSQLAKYFKNNAILFNKNTDMGYMWNGY